MSTSVASLSTNFFPSAENGFTTTTSGSVSSGATTVGLNSVAGYTNGEVVVFVIDPTDATKKQTFTGVIDTAGSQVTSVVWTAGTNQTHALGATVVDYATATHISMMTKGITQSLNQDGSLITQAVRDALNLDSGSSDGWTPFGYSLTSITALGNRSYTAVVSGVDTTGVTSVGQRLKLPRTVTAPTQSANLNGTTQYFSKSSPSGMTFTDDFVVSAWVKLSSYAQGGIASRFDSNSGWLFWVDSTGQVILQGNNTNGANYSRVRSYQSIPLNKWVHISAQLDMSAFTATTTTSYVMIDGKDVPANVERAGTNPTALVQAGNLEIGSINGGTNLFPGKIAQVAIYSAKVTQATILASMNQTLTGSETSLVSAYTFNNSINDLSANANNLTPQGSAVATNADTPFTNDVTGTSVTAGTTNYGIIMAQTFSTNTTYTIQIPEGETLPTTGGIGTVSYSTQKTPYGFPGEIGKWELETRYLSSETVTFGGINQWTGSNFKLVVPIGAWDVSYNANLQLHSTVAGPRNGLSSLYASTSNALVNGSYTGRLLSQVPYQPNVSDTIGVTTNSHRFNLSTAETFQYTASIFSSSGTETYVIPYQQAASYIRATNGYL